MIRRRHRNKEQTGYVCNRHVNNQLSIGRRQTRISCSLFIKMTDIIIFFEFLLSRLWDLFSFIYHSISKSVLHTMYLSRTSLCLRSEHPVSNTDVRNDSDEMSGGLCWLGDIRELIDNERETYWLNIKRKIFDRKKGRKNNGER